MGLGVWGRGGGGGWRRGLGLRLGLGVGRCGGERVLVAVGNKLYECSPA